METRRMHDLGKKPHNKVQGHNNNPLGGVKGLPARWRIGSLGDFLVAGRTLTAPVLVGSFIATYYGLDVTFGSPETSNDLFKNR